MPYDWFYFDLVKNVSREKTVHACQIPQALAELLMKAATQENDIVLLLFGGSGSEIEVCQRLNRHFISAEIDPKCHQMIEDRLQKGRIAAEYRLLYHLRKEVPEALLQPQLFDQSGEYLLQTEKE